MAADSAYAGAELKQLPDGVTWTTRLRVNAALHDLPPERTGKNGAPPGEGRPAPLPGQDRRCGAAFSQVTVTRYGKRETIAAHAFACLWYSVTGATPVTVILIRDKSKTGFDLALVTTEKDPDIARVVERYAARRAIETAFRTGKDAFGWDQCQAVTWASMCRHTALTALTQIRTVAARAHLAGTDVLPPAPDELPGSENPTEERPMNPDDLQIHTGDAPVPITAGQPCPPAIPSVRLSHAETGRLMDLARDWERGRLPLPRLAFHLRWSTWRRRPQARARWHHYAARLAA